MSSIHPSIHPSIYPSIHTHTPHEGKFTFNTEMSVPKILRPCGTIIAALSRDVMITADTLEGFNGKQ